MKKTIILFLLNWTQMGSKANSTGEIITIHAVKSSTINNIAKHGGFGLVGMAIANREKSTIESNFPSDSKSKEIPDLKVNPVRVFLGQITDTSTLFSEQYSILHFIRNNPHPAILSSELAMTRKDKELYIKGKIMDSSSVFYFFKSGKRYDSLTLIYNQKEFGKIYSILYAKLIGIITDKPTMSIYEKLKLKSNSLLPERNLKGGNTSYSYTFLPQEYKSTYPYYLSSSYATDCGYHSNNFELDKKSKDRESILYYLQAPKLYYEKENESMLFFRNSNIPEDAKEVARKIVFPVYNREGATITYLIAGDVAMDSSDYLTALLAFKSAIYKSDVLIGSNETKYKVKHYAYKKLEECFTKLNMKNSAGIAKLTHEIIEEYQKHDTTKIAKDVYSKQLSNLWKAMMEMERQAKSIKSSRFLGILETSVNGLASVSTAYTGGSSALTDGYRNEAIKSLDRMDEKITTSQKAIYDINRIANAKSFQLQDIGDVDLAEEPYTGEIVRILVTKDYMKNAIYGQLSYFEQNNPNESLKSALNKLKDSKEINEALTDELTEAFNFYLKKFKDEVK